MKVLGEDFFKPLHMVVHTRYVRFYSDGGMATVVSADAPNAALRKLMGARRGKLPGNCASGTFQIDGTEVVCEFLSRSESHPKMRPNLQKFVFKVDSTHKGAWNRLIFVRHEALFDGEDVVSFKVPQQPLRLVPFEGFTRTIEALPMDRAAMEMRKPDRQTTA
mmetsp:Transcript_572/g.1061  ORF Transcript_572/g.1061 Transcript_572/m.1061 type:complete len:163 (-) Transcript_572:51-539(-)